MHLINEAMRENVLCMDIASSILRRHTKLSPSSDAFWRFSWDEMAKYDLPAMVDYVVNVTKQPKIFYAGHSQGMGSGERLAGGESV